MQKKNLQFEEISILNRKKMKTEDNRSYYVYSVTKINRVKSKYIKKKKLKKKKFFNLANRFPKNRNLLQKPL